MSNYTNKPLHQFYIIDLLKLLIAHQRFIAIFTILALISSAIVSMILPTYYRSTTYIYPNNLTLTDKSTIFGSPQTGQSEFSYYGNKFDANRVLSLANSSVVIGKIIERYQLVKHYGNENKKFKWTETVLEFHENYEAFKNDRDAIEISIIDTDKYLAAKIVNDIAQMIDDLSVEPIKQHKLKVIKMLKAEIEQKTNELKTDPNKSAIINQELIQLRKSLTEYEVSANDHISAITIFEKGFPAEKKSKPIRWIIVLMSTIGALFVACIWVVVADQYRYLRGQIQPADTK